MYIHIEYRKIPAAVSSSFVARAAAASVARSSISVAEASAAAFSFKASPREFSCSARARSRASSILSAAVASWDARERSSACGRN